MSPLDGSDFKSSLTGRPRFSRSRTVIKGEVNDNSSDRLMFRRGKTMVKLDGNNVNEDSNERRTFAREKSMIQDFSREPKPKFKREKSAMQDERPQFVRENSIIKNTQYQQSSSNDNRDTHKTDKNDSSAPKRAGSESLVNNELRVSQSERANNFEQIRNGVNSSNVLTAAEYLPPSSAVTRTESGFTNPMTSFVLSNACTLQNDVLISQDQTTVKPKYTVCNNQAKSTFTTPSNAENQVKFLGDNNRQSGADGQSGDDRQSSTSAVERPRYTRENSIIKNHRNRSTDANSEKQSVTFQNDVSTSSGERPKFRRENSLLKSQRSRPQKESGEQDSVEEFEKLEQEFTSDECPKFSRENSMIRNRRRTEKTENSSARNKITGSPNCSGASENGTSDCDTKRRFAFKRENSMIRDKGTSRLPVPIVNNSRAKRVNPDRPRVSRGNSWIKRESQSTQSTLSRSLNSTSNLRKMVDEEKSDVDDPRPVFSRSNSMFKPDGRPPKPRRKNGIASIMDEIRPHFGRGHSMILDYYRPKSVEPCLDSSFRIPSSTSAFTERPKKVDSLVEVLVDSSEKGFRDKMESEDSRPSSLEDISRSDSSEPPPLEDYQSELHYFDKEDKSPRIKAQHQSQGSVRSSSGTTSPESPYRPSKIIVTNNQPQLNRESSFTKNSYTFRSSSPKSADLETVTLQFSSSEKSYGGAVERSSEGNSCRQLSCGELTDNNNGHQSKRVDETEKNPFSCSPTHSERDNTTSSNDHVSRFTRNHADEAKDTLSPMPRSVRNTEYDWSRLQNTTTNQEAYMDRKCSWKYANSLIVERELEKALDFSREMLKETCSNEMIEKLHEEFSSSRSKDYTYSRNHNDDVGRNNSHNGGSCDDDVKTNKLKSDLDTYSFHNTTEFQLKHTTEIERHAYVGTTQASSYEQKEAADFVECSVNSNKYELSTDRHATSLINDSYTTSTKESSILSDKSVPRSDKKYPTSNKGQLTLDLDELSLDNLSYETHQDHSRDMAGSDHVVTGSQSDDDCRTITVDNIRTFLKYENMKFDNEDAETKQEIVTEVNLNFHFFLFISFIYSFPKAEPVLIQMSFMNEDSFRKPCLYK